jgi:hypothetical protein
MRIPHKPLKAVGVGLVLALSPSGSHAASAFAKTCNENDNYDYQYPRIDTGGPAGSCDTSDSGGCVNGVFIESTTILCSGGLEYSCMDTYTDGQLTGGHGDCDW